MNRTWCALLLIVFSISSALSQTISKTWEFQQNDSIQQQRFGGASELHFNEGKFSFLKEEDTLAQGDYLYQNNLLVLFYNFPQDSIQHVRVAALEDNAMSLNMGGENFNFQARDPEVQEVVPAEVSKEIIPSQGLTLSSILRGVLGMFSLIVIAFLFSSNRRGINWKTVGLGLAAQLLLAIGVLKVTIVQKVFEFVGKIFVLILDFTMAGSEFLLGDLMNTDSFGFIFLFQILPTVIFFSALTSVLFYFGIIQVVVKGMAWVLTKLLGISGQESLSVAGNIFLGQTEAPLMIKAYLERMTRSEILLVMIGGMATVAGGVLAAYIGFLGGDDPELRLQFAKHLLTASVMAAPGAIVVSKILYPQTEKVNTDVSVSSESIGSNILDAIANGTTEGLKLAANVAAMLLVFIAFIAMINYILGYVGGLTTLNSLIAEYTPYSKFSLESILGLIFAPLMWLIGVAKEDVMLMGQLLGIKLAASEFVGYIQLAELKNPVNALSLQYEKSVIMATYMLCGFANFASIGIQIGGIGSLAPGQRKTLSEFGIKALIGGTLASLLSATIAGMIIG
ncbi:MAG: nucleoside transporter C-terminal domain-containing protein [Bacteroidota bacterium]|uniref:Nucleoside permease NupC n=1 Tax=Christiangramia flava JLT2011 TaxID=1229726 RepID=A0A1L7I5A0_9FLAO|nr:nucleoside transporter C-terminal domain-containing protein [Christiangramia flava]APU68799.1 Nucleoside permease NupC [Christiangramia flava JLT2011]MEE2771180.1 nucleoside transporter C-terminal domain-containing protein [Bacteroidota bacterium]OSS39056.1 Nucleoside permease NupC [Christiangramia flava JLT2011]